MSKRKNITGSKFNTSGSTSQTILPKIFNVAKMDKLEVYGKPSEELQKVITNFSVQTYNHFVDSVMNSYFIT
jgi:hypothetical protein